MRARLGAAVLATAALLFSGCGGGAPVRQAGAGGPPPDQPGEELISVEAEGETNVIEGNRLNTRDLALMNAQRKAVEKALGVLVSGQMVVSQARLIEDQVFSKTAGYLKWFEEIPGSEVEKDGLFTLRIRAKVRLGDVRKDVDALGMLIQTKKVGNPRIMLLIEETVDGAPAEGHLTETALSKPLLDKGYRLVDAEQLAELRTQAAVVKAARGEDPAEAADLGRKFGAEIVLVGTAAVKKAPATVPTGDETGLGSMTSYRGRLALKAVKTSNGQVVLADTREGNGTDLMADSASQRCLTDMAEAAGAELGDKLAPALFEQAEVQVAVSGVKDFPGLQAIVNRLRAADGVRNVVTRSFTAGEGVFDVELAGGNAQTLAAQLEAGRTVPMTVTEVAAYRIQAALGSTGGGQ